MTWRDSRRTNLREQGPGEPLRREMNGNEDKEGELWVTSVNGGPSASGSDELLAAKNVLRNVLRSSLDYCIMDKHFPGEWENSCHLWSKGFKFSSRLRTSSCERWQLYYRLNKSLCSGSYSDQLTQTNPGDQFKHTPCKSLVRLMHSNFWINWFLYVVLNTFEVFLQAGTQQMEDDSLSLSQSLHLWDFIWCLKQCIYARLPCITLCSFVRA